MFRLKNACRIVSRWPGGWGTIGWDRRGAVWHTSFPVHSYPTLQFCFAFWCISGVREGRRISGHLSTAVTADAVVYDGK